MSDAAMIMEIDGIEFQWHGGAYIEVGYTSTEDSHTRNNEGIPSHYAGEFVANEVINVWDYEKDEAQISGFQEFQARCQEWVDDHREEI